MPERCCQLWRPPARQHLIVLSACLAAVTASSSRVASRLAGLAFQGGKASTTAEVARVSKEFVPTAGSCSIIKRPSTSSAKSPIAGTQRRAVALRVRPHAELSLGFPSNRVEMRQHQFRRSSVSARWRARLAARGAVVSSTRSIAASVSVDVAPDSAVPRLYAGPLPQEKCAGQIVALTRDLPQLLEQDLHLGYSLPWRAIQPGQRIASAPLPGDAARPPGRIRPAQLQIGAA